MISTLHDMLSYRRPAGSKTERRFISRYIASLPYSHRDAFGNWHVVTDKASPILWSAHTDTVHRMGGMQTIIHWPTSDMITLGNDRRTDDSNCLGADDTIGVYLLRQMVLAGVPGHYIFHYAEERGGIGSFALADDWPIAFNHLRIAIALDRRNSADVITHQGSRCCSDTFAGALADALNIADGLHYRPSDEGIFTDTANYVDVIPECTNLSVGYAREHTASEWIDVGHVRRLEHALCKGDFSMLPIERDPHVVDVADHWSFRYTDDRDYDRASHPMRDANRYLDPVYREVQLALAAQARRAYHPAVDFGACRYCGEEFADDTIIVCPFCDEERD